MPDKEKSFNIGTLGMQAASGAIGTGLGLLLEKHEDRRQLKQQQALQNMQMQGNKEMTDYNTEAQRKKEMQMWLDTNYTAQMQELEKAGLNPAMIYGMSGGGGTTVGGGGISGNVSSGEAPRGTGTATAMGLAMAQANLLAAQTENVKADTKKKESEIPVNSETATSLQLDNLFKDTTMGKRIQQVTIDTRQKIEDLQIAETKNYINKDTALDQILEIANHALKTGFEATGQDIQNALTNEQIEKVKSENAKVLQDITNSIEQLKQGWKGLSIQQMNTNIARFLAEYTANHPDIGKVTGGVIQRIAAAFGKPTNEIKVPK